MRSKWLSDKIRFAPFEKAIELHVRGLTPALISTETVHNRNLASLTIHLPTIYFPNLGPMKMSKTRLLFFTEVRLLVSIG